MAIINIKNLELGSILKTDVKDINGRMLITAGMEITEKHIQTLKTWGITEVTILGEDQGNNTQEPSDIDPKIMAIINTQINEHFLFSNNNHPAIQEIIKIVKQNAIKEHLIDPSVLNQNV